ncbi:MAG: lysophospholipid acyltransferase family protein [Alphaproteobacteria bacterium]
MTSLRAIAFNILFYAWTTVVSLLALPLLLLPSAATLAYSRFWINGSFAILRLTVGLRHRLRGTENIPSGPAIFACKHQSAWETLAFHILLPNPVFVLKRELMLIPVWGWLVRRSGMIPVDRSGGSAALRQMLIAAKAIAKTGRPIIVFPQGTRTPPGSKRPYQAGIAALYKGLSLPVVPVALNSGLFWPRRASTRIRSGIITVEFLPAIPPGLPRREFMTRLETSIENATAILEAEGAGNGN